ncbi:aerolysin family beta-barrel pore-forming toxin [Vibrio campbellii]|uniref:Aerolysin family beta-barrel pore-forming toxin n=1 Tax=Vibrio campbellii TaxID=680 RepID=A0ABY5ICN8_9VIBR|nr:aerolysin family beta-barrel pore-forming toxin [Vibrio campbellii]UTZ21927.1 aerolysin family beta-barrel pore-forming toxin [Vibrio campbellii]UTZ30661.1 aerolysin family beta-barrel pore-forming toxin [Vibrio campbellii]
MISINKSILAAAVLSVLSTGVNARIYPDQIVRDNLGEDVCRSDYRPLNRDEATEHKFAILQKMGQWDIIGLKDNWVIKGPGYDGVIKEDGPNDQTFCYPNSDDSEIPVYPAFPVEPGRDHVDVEYNLTHMRQSFVRPLSYLAHRLGYAWVGGNNSPYIGEDMVIYHWNDQWIIQGSQEGSCSGYRCNDKTQIVVDNFAFNVKDNTFWHGEVTESDRELVETIHATATNHTDQEQQAVVDITVNTSTNWSKTNSHGFAESVSVENEFNWPVVGDTKVNVKFEANQSWAEQNGGSTSKTVTLQTRPMVPPHSTIPIKVDLYRSNISYPYQFNANMSYDVLFYGFLRHGGNAWHSHPTNRPTMSHKFTIGRASDQSADIPYQWYHRYIPGEVKWWDWSWAIQQEGLGNMQWAVGASLRQFYSTVSGNFSAEAQYAGEIEIGQPSPIGRARSSIEGESQTTIDLGGVEVTTDFDAEELSDLGFEGAEFDVRLAD